MTSVTPSKRIGEVEIDGEQIYRGSTSWGTPIATVKGEYVYKATFLESRRAIACVSGVLLRDQLPNLGHQIVRYIHDGLGRLNAGFILSQCLVFGLFSVVGKDPLYLVRIPPVWKFVLAH